MSKISGKRARSVRVLEDLSVIVKSAEIRAEQELEGIRDLSLARNASEKAWVVMLIKQGIIPEKDGAVLLRAIGEFEEEDQPLVRPVFTPSSSYSIWSMEKAITDKIGADLAGNINIGKTLPEPVARLKIRDKTLDVLSALLTFLETLLSLADRYRETVMPGYTHMAQAQPMSFGHYLLSVFDPLSRALVDLETGYQRANQNTLGCGALSGSSWPVDREMVAELLGFDGVLENSNDCVASMDFCLNILGALTNIMMVIGRLTLDLQIWGMEEIKMVGVPESYSDTSSMMPQKKNYGGQLERVRMDSAMIVGRFQETAVLPKNEPFGDMLAVMRTRYPVLESLCVVEKDLAILGGFLSALIPDEERMYDLARAGFSCASELANIIVRRCALSYRQAHHVAGTLVRMAEERRIQAHQVTPELVDEAAGLVIGRSLDLSAELIRAALDPREFIRAHGSQGGVAPEEVKRMAAIRIAELHRAKDRQDRRGNKIAEAQKRLQKEIKIIVSTG